MRIIFIFGWIILENAKTYKKIFFYLTIESHFSKIHLWNDMFPQISLSSLGGDVVKTEGLWSLSVAPSLDADIMAIQKRIQPVKNWALHPASSTLSEGEAVIENRWKDKWKWFYCFKMTTFNIYAKIWSFPPEASCTLFHWTKLIIYCRRLRSAMVLKLLY